MSEASLDTEHVRAAEIIGALSLATDLGIGVPLEHGLHSTLIAMRLIERMGIDKETAMRAYYACLLFYIGCTAGAETAARLFGSEDALTTYATPTRFGSRTEMISGFMRALAPPENPVPTRAVQIARGVPRAARAFKTQVAAQCEVGQMLSNRLGLLPSVQMLFVHLAERWDGKGEPGLSKREEIPLAVRIVHVARDAAFQRMLGGEEFAARVVRDRGGGAFDPDIAACLADGSGKILALDPASSAWNETLASEPMPHLILEGDAIDDALAAMGDFADLVSRFLVGHSAGVAELAAAAAMGSGFESADVKAIRRAGHVHDLGRVAVPAGIWQKPSALTPDEWESVRLHAYHSERVLSHSRFLSSLASVATAHHERLDGSGYHKGVPAAGLTPAARLLAAADAFHAMTEPRAHRPALSPEQAGEILTQEAREGRIDPDAASAVLEAAGRPAPPIERPSGLTDRESEVIGLLARGLLTKEIARVLGISIKTADRHIQNAYAKIGVSTRAAAALFAMEHGLVVWGEIPISRGGPDS